MRITADLLRSKGASCRDVAIFAAEWPNGGDVSKAALLRAAELRLNLHWVALHFFSPPLLAEYNRQEAPLRAEYDRQEAKSLAEGESYELVPIWDECMRREALLIWKLWNASKEMKP